MQTRGPSRSRHSRPGWSGVTASSRSRARPCAGRWTSAEACTSSGVRQRRDPAIGLRPCRRRHRCCSAGSSTTRRSSRRRRPRSPTPCAAHAVHRGAWYAECIGPLLVPAAAVADLLEASRAPSARTASGMPDSHAPPDAVRRHPPQPPVRRCARVVSSPAPVPTRPPSTALSTRCATRSPRPGRRRRARRGRRAGATSGLDDLAVALEVPRGARPCGRRRRRAQCAAREGLAGRREVPHRTHPDLALARRGRARRRSSRLVALEVPFKLTGGLHHAVRGTYEVAGAPEENHGVLNVLRRHLRRARRRRSGRGRRPARRARRHRPRRARRRLARRHGDPRARGVHRLRVLHRDRPGR